ncbi:Phospholipase D [Rhynchospora pubera]|uniref:phospholipase D n=1 Tax=Rhynchospora pubera TaxID=906938 RepID=A0AAV8F6S4_9POAL|nr:Phospholipase D [Rhynchospora pubera]
MDSRQNSYPPYVPPNQSNWHLNQPTTSPYLSHPASFPSDHPHYLAPQFSHSGPLQYPPHADTPTPYYNPYSAPPIYPNLNSSHHDPSLYPDSQPSSFHHMGSGQYHNPNPLDLNQSSSSFHHTCNNQYDNYDMANHLSHYSPTSSSDSISSLHDGLAYVHISDSRPDHAPPVITPLTHHQKYDLCGNYPISPISTPPASITSVPQHNNNQIVPYSESPGSKGKSSLQVLLLHGSLEIIIRYARNLPNKDMFHRIFGDPLLKPQKDAGHTTSDPYVTVSVPDVVIASTYVIDNNENPEWDQHFYVSVAHETAEVLFTVKDKDVLGAQNVGTVSIPSERLYSGERIDDIFPVLSPNGKPCNQGAVLSFLIQYIPVARLTMYHHGVGPDYKGVPNTYFSLRRGGKVTLYQDAHVSDNCLPNFWLENGMQYKHNQCWRDVFDAISGATRLIYIAGWSVFHTVTLVRDGGIGNMVMLGDLLKSKSQDGTRVCLLIWDDWTSLRIVGNTGKMHTNDEQTRRFFKHSSVNVLLCPRAAGKMQSIVKQLEVDTRGPRVPWHDLHCKIDGPAAYDVLANFVDRWFKAAEYHGRKKMEKSYDDMLLNLKFIPEICLDDAPYMSDNDTESWHVQVFRSVDSNSAKSFPKDPRLASQLNLACGRNVLIDMSIHTAYVNAIRAAQHFIYIENQYFLGSSFSWDSNKDAGANNLIPIEIALKIANKIKANERFAAYIVIPMWPEGEPTSAPIQRILYWQKKTMQMMYETIYMALREAGLENKYEPQDYLNFFCLGNREPLDRVMPEENYNSNIAQENARKHRRFMIYVHSKGMIVDDEYVIIGSANINQRSLDGTVDTEIAMGAHQPQHTWAAKQSAPHGQIYGYRMSLWAEHTGTVEEIFNQPQSLECVQRLRTMGELNWKQFVADEVTEMRSHLLKYPLNVDRRGKVTPLPGCEKFPDVGGEIGGSPLPVPGFKNLPYFLGDIGSYCGIHETLTK